MRKQSNEKEKRNKQADSKGIPLKEAFRLTLRGFGIINKRLPRFMPLAALKSFATAITPLLVLFMSARILNELTGAREINRIWIYVCTTVGLTFILTVLRLAVACKLVPFDTSLFGRFQGLLGERYMTLDFGHVERNEVNEKLADIEAKAGGNGLGLLRLYRSFTPIAEVLFSLIFSTLLLIGLFQTEGDYTAGFITSHGAAVVLAVLIALAVWLNFKMRQGEQGMLNRIFEDNPKTNTLIGYYYKYSQPNAAAKDIRLYNQCPTIMEISQKRTSMAIWHEFFDYEGKLHGFEAAVSAVIGGMIYLFIGLRALAGMYGVGSVVQYVGAVTGLVQNLATLTAHISTLTNNAVFLKQTFDYLDLPGIQQKGSLTTEKRDDNDYEVAFHNVSFKYAGTDTYALKNLTLSFNIGKRLAVVGMNGSGKTTMIKLLCRLYDPDEGMITLNGIDIRKYDYDEYMALFSVVFQDFNLFSFPLGQTVASAVAYDAERVQNCLAVTGFGERLKAFPQGLETTLYKGYDENGVQISGGEAQRIALARSLYKDAPFIILDEPTAALDPLAEYEIYTKFDEIVGSRTAVYISHRLSSCRFCDDIAVFHEGRLVQRGRHDELLADEQGKYFELWTAQAQYYTEKEKAS